MTTSNPMTLTTYALEGPRFVEKDLIERTGSELTHLVEDDRRVVWLAVDFAGVSVVSSVGLGMLVAIRKLVLERGGRMVLMNVKSEAVQQVFRVTKLSTLFPIVATEQEALLACQSES